MAYGLLGLKTHMEGNSLNAMRSLADSQEKNKIANENIKQAAKAQKTNSIAGGAAMGASIAGPWGALAGAIAGAIF